MPTSEYTDNVVALAGLALDAYQPGRLLYQALQPLGDEDQLEDAVLVATVAGGSRDLRNVTAVFGAVQLVFDAAIVAVSYAAELPGGAGERNIDFLRNLASDPAWTYEIEELSGGSFRVRVKALFASRRNRTTLIATATIATAILAVALPPVTVPLLIVTATGGAETILENVLEERLGRRREKERRAQGEPPASPNHQVERVRELHREGIAKAEDASLGQEMAALKAKVSGLAEQVTDLQAAAAANVTDIRVEVKTGVQEAA